MCPSVKRRFSIQIHTHHTQGGCMWWRQRSGWCIHKPRISKGHQQLLEAGWGVGRGPEQIPSTPLRRNHHLALRCPASRTVRQYISIGLSHPVCSTLLEQPQQTKTKSWLFEKWAASTWNQGESGAQGLQWSIECEQIGRMVSYGASSCGHMEWVTFGDNFAVNLQKE